MVVASPEGWRSYGRWVVKYLSLHAASSKLRVTGCRSLCLPLQKHHISQAGEPKQVGFRGVKRAARSNNWRGVRVRRV